METDDNHNFFFFFFHHTTCESTCDTLASSAANQGDNAFSVAQCNEELLCYKKQKMLLEKVLKFNFKNKNLVGFHAVLYLILIRKKIRKKCCS